MSKPPARPRITSLRTTSLSPRSSLGSGSEIPLSFASSTAWLKGRPRFTSSKRKVRVPESTPSISMMWSPLRCSSVTVRTIGSPAPTVVSWWRPPPSSAARMRSW